MVLYSAKPWVDISSYSSGFVSRHRIAYGTRIFTEKRSYLGYLSLLIFMICKSSCLGIKSRNHLDIQRRSFNINNRDA